MSAKSTAGRMLALRAANLGSNPASDMVPSALGMVPEHLQESTCALLKKLGSKLNRLSAPVLYWQPEYLLSTAGCGPQIRTQK